MRVVNEMKQRCNRGKIDKSELFSMITQFDGFDQNKFGDIMKLFDNALSKDQICEFEVLDENNIFFSNDIDNSIWLVIISTSETNKDIIETMSFTVWDPQNDMVIFNITKG